MVEYEMTTTAATYALTTIFTPPASCQNVTWVSSTCPSSTCEAIYNIVRSTETECYPSGWETTATIFSPGLICPSGYTIADETTSSYGATEAETLATCCPSGFTYATDWVEPWWSTEPCVMTSDITTTITYTVMGVTPTNTTAITYYTPTIHAMPIGLAWQSSDLSLSTPVSTSAPTTGASTSSSSSITTSSSSSSSNNSGLSGGAKAGTGVGVAVGAILIASAIGALFYLRKKKQKSLDSMSYSEGGVEVRSIPQSSPTELSG